MKSRIARRRASQAVSQYGAPGQGASTAIGVVTVLLLLGGWWLVTQLELIRPLFLPSPEMVISKSAKIACTQHYLEQLLAAVGARTGVEAHCTSTFSGAFTGSSAPFCWPRSRRFRSASPWA